MVFGRTGDGVKCRLFWENWENWEFWDSREVR